MKTFKGLDQYELIDILAPGLESYMEDWLTRRLTVDSGNILEDARECAYLEYEAEMQHQLYIHFLSLPEPNFRFVRQQLIDFVFRIAEEQGEKGYPLFYYVLPHIEEKEEFLRYFFLLYPKLWS